MSSNFVYLLLTLTGERSSANGALGIKCKEKRGIAGKVKRRIKIWKAINDSLGCWALTGNTGDMKPCITLTNQNVDKQEYHIFRDNIYVPWTISGQLYKASHGRKYQYSLMYIIYILVLQKCTLGRNPDYEKINQWAYIPQRYVSYFYIYNPE